MEQPEDCDQSSALETDDETVMEQDSIWNRTKQLFGGTNE